MLGVHKAISLPQSTEYAKEMAKWEAHHTQWGPPGRPYQFHEYPKRMCRAEYVPGEGFKVVEGFNANTRDEELNFLSRGFGVGHAGAIEIAERAHTEAGRLAAEREFAIQHGRHSERAVAEVRAAEAEYGARHLPEVPETPIKRRGRKPKAAEPIQA